MVDARVRVRVCVCVCVHTPRGVFATLCVRVCLRCVSVVCGRVYGAHTQTSRSKMRAGPQGLCTLRFFSVGRVRAGAQGRRAQGTLHHTAKNRASRMTVTVTHSAAVMRKVGPQENGASIGEACPACTTARRQHSRPRRVWMAPEGGGGIPQVPDVNEPAAL